MASGKPILIPKQAGICYATVGVHPCSAMTFDSHPSGPHTLLSLIEILAQDSKTAGTATAFGEFGLDYDRLFHAPKETQLKYFEAQLEVAVRVQLPLFLHSRAAHGDFVRLLKKVLGEKLEKIEKGGLVHSFTGTVEEMQELVDLGLHVGINGCSMKTEENLEVVKAIPLDRLQIETDGPWVSFLISMLLYRNLFLHTSALETLLVTSNIPWTAKLGGLRLALRPEKAP